MSKRSKEFKTTGQLLSRRSFLTLLAATTTAISCDRLFAANASKPLRDDRIRELQQKPFDFIVIGAGSAGCTLTARLLRDDPTATVLLVEAGGTNDRAKIRDPAGSFELTAPGSDVDWGYKSTPSEATEQQTAIVLRWESSRRQQFDKRYGVGSRQQI